MHFNSGIKFPERNTIWGTNHPLSDLSNIYPVYYIISGLTEILKRHLHKFINIFLLPSARERTENYLFKLNKKFSAIEHPMLL